jgi:hypothetical protein
MECARGASSHTIGAMMEDAFPATIRPVKSRFFSRKGEARLPRRPGQKPKEICNDEQPAATQRIQADASERPQITDAGRGTPSIRLRRLGADSRGISRSKRDFFVTIQPTCGLPRRSLRWATHTASAYSPMRHRWSRVLGNVASGRRWDCATWADIQRNNTESASWPGSDRPNGLRESIAQVPPSLDVDSYAAMLTNEWILSEVSDLLKEPGLLWRPDNARPSSPVRIKWASRLRVLPWPARSSNLSPIERMWACLKNQIRGHWKRVHELNKRRQNQPHLVLSGSRAVDFRVTVRR